MFVQNAITPSIRNGGKPQLRSMSAVTVFSNARIAEGGAFAMFQKKMRIEMRIYYCVTLLANAVAAIAFYQNIHITKLSILPLFLMILMAFQAFYFKSEKVSHGSSTTAYGSNLTPKEENEMLVSGSRVLFAAIPWMIPFVLFFPSPIKILSVILYVLALIVGPVFYKMKNKKKIIKRMSDEERDH